MRVIRAVYSMCIGLKQVAVLVIVRKLDMNPLIGSIVRRINNITS